MQTTTAIQHRARTALLFNALTSTGREREFYFWQGYAKALRDLHSGTADTLAAKDAALQGYQAPGFLQAAADCLGVDIYTLPRAQVVQRLAQAGIKFPTEDLAERDAGAAHQLKHAAVPAVNGDGEHAAHSVDGNHDASVHGDSLNTKAVILTQGRAA